MPGRIEGLHFHGNILSSWPPQALSPSSRIQCGFFAQFSLAFYPSCPAGGLNQHTMSTELYDGLMR